MRPEDFAECGIVLDATTGRQFADGYNDHGAHIRCELYVPLCLHCDKPISPEGYCFGCEIIHVGEAA
jgi:hypothetical protein